MRRSARNRHCTTQPKSFVCNFEISQGGQYASVCVIVESKCFSESCLVPVEIGGGLLPLRNTNFGLLPGGRKLFFFIWFPTRIAVHYNSRFNKSCFIRSKSPLDAQVELFCTWRASCNLITWITTIVEYMQPLDERRAVFFALPAKMTSNECQKPSSLRSINRHKECAILHSGHCSKWDHSHCSNSAPQSTHFSFFHEKLIPPHPAEG